MTETLVQRVERLKTADDATRLAFLQEKHLVLHPKMLNVEGKLRTIVESPDPFELSRAFFAPSFNGKSTVSKHFASLYPPDPNPLGDATVMKVVRISLPGEASVREFAVRILTATKEPFNQRWATSHLMSCAYAILKALGVRLLIIDEFQDLRNGTHRNRETLKNIIKSIGEDCGCGVALFGMPDGVDIVCEDPQLVRRFELDVIAPWQVDEDTRALLHNFEAILPLRKRSGMAANPALIQLIIDQSDGVMGHIRRVVYEAARTAIQTGREIIDAGTIAVANWIPLSERPTDTRNRLYPPGGNCPRKGSL